MIQENQHKSRIGPGYLDSGSIEEDLMLRFLAGRVRGSW